MLVLTDQNFEEEVLKSNLPVLVDFYADWCFPCKIVGPVVEEVTKEYAGRIKIGKMDVDQNPKMAEKYEILSIPTLMIFKDGKIIEQIIGVKSKEELERVINEVI
jgi:thioredoxin 1